MSIPSRSEWDGMSIPSRSERDGISIPIPLSAFLFLYILHSFLFLYILHSFTAAISRSSALPCKPETGETGWVCITVLLGITVL